MAFLKFNINWAKIKKWFFILLALSVVGAGITFTAAYNVNFSKGVRGGKIMKFSKRGMFFKTYEGQLDKGGIQTSKDGALGSTWDFSVSSSRKDIIKTLEEAATTGERVRLDYEEKFFKFAWRGDSKYIVTGVTREDSNQNSNQNNSKNMMDKSKEDNAGKIDKEKMEQEIRAEIKLKEELKQEIKEELKQELKEEIKKEILEEIKAEQTKTPEKETK